MENTNTRVLTQDQLDDLFEFIKETGKKYEIPGFAAAIVQGRQIDHRVFGLAKTEAETEAPVTDDTLFHIASTHKSINAMLIAQLVDQGKLTWDQPVKEIYPDFELSDETATNQVTISHLLSMNSGIPAEAEDIFKKKFKNRQPAKAEDIFELLPEIKLLGKPGKKFSYSNIAAAVAGYIGVLANDSSQIGQLYEGYEQLLNDYIFDPIGMKTATLSLKDQAKNYSASYRYDECGYIVVSEQAEDPNYDALAPSGFIKASIQDMAHYMSTQVSQGIAPNGNQVVSKENLLKTWKPPIEQEKDGGQYGMGWEMEDEDIQVIFHEGSYDSFSSLLLFAPEKRCGIVLLTNLDDPGKFIEQVSDKFIESLKTAEDA